jgi:hypothetical protein
VGIEVNDRDGAMQRGHGAQQWQGDGVVATDRHESVSSREGGACSNFDLADSRFDVERVTRNVARVGDLMIAPRLDIEVRVIRAQEFGTIANRLRAESRSGTVGNPGIEGDTENRYGRMLYVIESRQASEGVRAGVSRGDASIRRPERTLLRSHGVPSEVAVPCYSG